MDVNIEESLFELAIEVMVQDLRMSEEMPEEAVRSTAEQRIQDFQKQKACSAYDGHLMFCGMVSATKAFDDFFSKQDGYPRIKYSNVPQMFAPYIMDHLQRCFTEERLDKHSITFSKDDWKKLKQGFSEHIEILSIAYQTEDLLRVEVEGQDCRPG